jgi:hypothetical protein
MNIKNFVRMIIAVHILPMRHMIQSPMASYLKWCLFVAVIAGSFLLPAQLGRAADTLYVDWCATGTEPPYHTLTSAVAAANPGDSLIMEAGIYPETLSIWKTLNIFSQNGAAIIGKDKYNVGWKDVTVFRPCEDTYRNARVYYPSWAPGPNTQIAYSCQGTFPVVVYAHGLSRDERDICEGWINPGPFSDDYKQAGGILSQLAASGIIAVSVSWGEAGSGATVVGKVMIDTIAYLRNKNQEQGSWLQGMVDLTRVGLSGHSTGGAGAVDAAFHYNQGNYCPEHGTLDVQIKGLGLVAPAWPWYAGNSAVNIPKLLIHGTREHCRQVGLAPLEYYCESSAPKHLVYITGANHFGYTDGICLDPEVPAPSQNCIPDRYDIDASQYLPTSVGEDNDSQVGGVTEKEAHTLQQRAAANYLEAFFSYYLKDDAGALDYLVQKDGTQPQCGHPGNKDQCKDDFVEAGPPVDPPTDCEPKMLFDDLVSSNVEVKVCHAITCP